MNYRDHIIAAMNLLAQDDKVRFCGYNVAYGGKGGGTFAGIEQSKLIEFPLAENLMMGACVGMSLDGLIPLCYVERSDFLTNCFDPIVNHLDKLATLSNGLHKPAVIIRVVVGNRDVPLFTGPTHTQDLSYALEKMVSFPVLRLRHNLGIENAYATALDAARRGFSAAFFEYKDLYSEADPEQTGGWRPPKP